MYRARTRPRGVLLAAAMLAAAGAPAAAQNAGQAQERRPTHDEHLERLAGRIPGFGGYFIGEDGQLTVYLTSPGERGIAQAVLAQELAGRPFSTRQRVRPDPRQLRVLEAAYDFPRLRGWYQAHVRPLAALDGVAFTDIDEKRNRLLVALERDDDALRARIAEALARGSVPAEAVIVEVRGPSMDFRTPAPSLFGDAGGQAQTLSSRFRPVPGGVAIRYERSGFTYPCTLGVNVRLSSTAPIDFITASHCTTARGGGTDNSHEYQPNAVTTDDIGTEVSDPGYFYNATNTACPLNERCRYADVARFRYSIANAVNEFGQIAQTETSSRTSGSTTIAIGRPRFRVLGSYPYPIPDEVLDKIGSATGWTWGGVINTCADRVVSEGTTTTRYLCLAIVDAGAGGGDSGGPVFSLAGGNDVYFIGLLQGGYTNATTGRVNYYFSPMDGIERDLGFLYVN